MRRQVGATHFDIDATKGYARFAFTKPVPIDWEVIADTADSAGYTVNDYQFVVEGTVTRAHCESCAEEVTVLRARGTGQEFELEGNVPKPGSVRLRSLAEGWEYGHITLDVVEHESLDD